MRVAGAEGLGTGTELARGPGTDGLGTGTELARGAGTEGLGTGAFFSRTGAGRAAAFPGGMLTMLSKASIASSTSSFPKKLLFFGGATDSLALAASFVSFSDSSAPSVTVFSLNVSWRGRGGSSSSGRAMSMTWGWS